MERRGKGRGGGNIIAVYCFGTSKRKTKTDWGFDSSVSVARRAAI